MDVQIYNKFAILWAAYKRTLPAAFTVYSLCVCKPVAEMNTKLLAIIVMLLSASVQVTLACQSMWGGSYNCSSGGECNLMMLQPEGPPPWTVVHCGYMDFSCCIR